MHEVELKFQVPPERRAALAAALERRGGGPPVRPVRLRAAYWDTPERALARVGLALRVRREGRAWVQTLKGAGADGMTRLEHNVPLARVAKAAPAGIVPADPALHNGTPVGERLRAVLGPPADAALRLLYRTDVLRRTRAVVSRQGRVELAFDEGRIDSGGRSIPVCELEFELLDGSPSAVVAMARRWLPRFDLWLDMRSKAERGDLLARGETMAPPRPAQPVALVRGMTLAQARITVLRSCADQVCVNASQIAAGEHGAEHVHQLRVGLRRLRCALALFGSGPSDRALADAAAALFRRLGAARDQAVLRGAVFDDLAAALRSAGLPGVVPLPVAVPGAENPVHVVRSAEAQNLLLALLGTAAASEPEDGAAAATATATATTARRTLRRRLEQWHRRCVTQARRWPELDDEGRHRLRKQVKRLRYAVEFAEGLFERRALRRYARPLRALQERLGQVTDVTMAIDAHRNSRPDETLAGFALGWLIARNHELIAAAGPELKAFAKSRRFWAHD